MTEAKLKRRWLPRFGLRTLIAAVTLMGILLGAAMTWYRQAAAEYRRQLQITAGLEKLRASVDFQPCCPAWLDHSCIGKACLRAKLVSFHDNDKIVKALGKLQELPSVTELLMTGAQCNDETFQALAKLKQLKTITVTEVTDATLGKTLKNLPEIQIRWLSGWVNFSQEN